MSFSVYLRLYLASTARTSPVAPAAGRFQVGSNFRRIHCARNLTRARQHFIQLVARRFTFARLRSRAPSTSLSLRQARRCDPLLRPQSRCRDRPGSARFLGSNCGYDRQNEAFVKRRKGRGSSCASHAPGLPRFRHAIAPEPICFCQFPEWLGQMKQAAPVPPVDRSCR